MEKYINKIICADSREILKLFPDGAVDLLLTDPPYGGGTVARQKENADVSAEYSTSIISATRTGETWAAKYGRRFICIESDRFYYEKSVERLNQTQRQQTLF